MANEFKPDSGRVPITTAAEVRHFAGPIADHSVVEILELRPTVEQLEIAALHARGQSVRPEKAAEELSGLAGLLYEVLMQDEIYLPEDQ